MIYYLDAHPDPVEHADTLRLGRRRRQSHGVPVQLVPRISRKNHRGLEAEARQHHDDAVLAHAHDIGLLLGDAVLEEDVRVQVRRSPARELRHAVPVVEVVGHVLAPVCVSVSVSVSVCVCVRARACACVRVRVPACVRACVVLGMCTGVPVVKAVGNVLCTCAL